MYVAMCVLIVIIDYENCIFASILVLLIYRFLGEQLTERRREGKRKRQRKKRIIIEKL
jgi:uncharacterized membrane protein YdjX (TVP38/TMEM64 family)